MPTKNVNTNVNRIEINIPKQVIRRQKKKSISQAEEELQNLESADYNYSRNLPSVSYTINPNVYGFNTEPISIPTPPIPEKKERSISPVKPPSIPSYVGPKTASESESEREGISSYMRESPKIQRMYEYLKKEPDFPQRLQQQEIGLSAPTQIASYGGGGSVSSLSSGTSRSLYKSNLALAKQRKIQGIGINEKANRIIQNRLVGTEISPQEYSQIGQGMMEGIGLSPRETSLQQYWEINPQHQQDIIPPPSLPTEEIKAAGGGEKRGRGRPRKTGRILTTTSGTEIPYVTKPKPEPAVFGEKKKSTIEKVKTALRGKLF